MYIDFSDPEKNSYDSSFKAEETPTPEPVKKTGFDKFRRKKTKKKSEKEMPVSKEEFSSSDKLKIKDSVSEKSNNGSSLDILQKINQVIAEQNGDSELNTQESVDKKINTLKQEESKSLSLNEDSVSREPRVTSDADFNESYPPPTVPKIGRGGFQAFEFRGAAGEFFKIWIVNVVLSLLTLGIYSAWAKVRTNRYLYGNTYLNNSNFEYNADPKRILIGRVIIVLFYGLFLLFGEYLNMPIVAVSILGLFLLFLPWLVRQAIKFRLKSASYRNIPFNFYGKVRSFYAIFVSALLLFVSPMILFFIFTKVGGGAITPSNYAMGILFSFAFFLLVAPILYVFVGSLLYKKYKSLVINNSTYGNSRFFFNATYKDALKAFGKIALLIIVVSLIIVAVSYGIRAMHISPLNYLLESAKHSKYLQQLIAVFAFNPSLIAVLLSIPSALVIVFYKGFIDGVLSNFTRNHASLEGARFRGEIKAIKLGWISVTNLIMLIFSIGLLYPYTKLRYLRYKIENSYFEGSNYDNIASQGYEDTNAIGEEAMDFFDIDIGI